MVQAYLGDVFPVVPEFLEGGHGRKPGGVPTSNGLQTWPHTQPYRWWLQWGQEEARELEKAERHHGGEGVNVESVPQTGEAPVWSQREAGGKGQWTWDTCQHSQSRTAPVSPGAFPAIPAASLPRPNVLPEAADGETEARGNSGTQSPLWPSPTPPRCPPSPHPPLPSAPHPHVPQGPACFPPPQDGCGGGAVWVTLCDQGGLSPTAKLHVRLTPLISSNEPSPLPLQMLGLHVGSLWCSWGGGAEGKGQLGGRAGAQNTAVAPRAYGSVTAPAGCTCARTRMCVHTYVCMCA